MPKRICRIFLFPILCLQILTAQETVLDSLLQNIRERYDVVGMSVVVLQDSGITFSGHYGMRDLNRNLPVTQMTQYRIASISKMITATAVMQLYEQGLFELDEDVSDYLPFSLRNPNYSEQVITFRKLLSHTGSLRDGSGYHGFLSASYSQSPPPVLAELLQPGGGFYSADMFSSAQSPAAAYFQYANINFGILGTLVESISGQRFDVYCRKHIFEPLGMTASFNVTDLPEIDDLAVLYREQNGHWVAQFDNYGGIPPGERDLSAYSIGSNGVIFAPQGGLRCSAEDLAKFMAVHLQGGIYHNQRILADSTTALMHRKVWEYNGNNGNYYYGIFRNYALGNHTTPNLLPGESLTGHPGEAYGLISDIYFSRSGRYGIVFITNGGNWGYGSYSGWYNMEERVFQACFDYLSEQSSVNQGALPEAPDFRLHPNAPNPFNASTLIRYSLERSAAINLSIYNLLGERMQTLVSQNQTRGHYSILWQAADLPSGNYCYRLAIDDQVRCGKCLLLK